jgi:hypothetical protein
MAVWSEVAWSNLTDDARLDAEYYRPEYLSQEGAIEAGPRERLDSIADVSDGNHISIAGEFCETGIRYLRGQDLSDFFVSDSDPAYIPEPTYDTLKRSHMRPGDVLLGVVATIGTVSLVTDRFGKLTGNCKIAIVRPRAIESEYLAAYFSSLVGQRELHRRARGSVQTGVILPDLKAMLIPTLDEATRAAIVKKVKAAYSSKMKAKETYAEAEGLLESVLGLDKLDLSPRLFYERSYADVQAAARLDAEYACVPDLLSVWTPPCPVLPLSDRSISKWVANGATPASDEYGSSGIPILKVGDLTNHGSIDFGGEYVIPGTKTLKTNKGEARPGDLFVLAAAHHVSYIGATGILEDWPDDQRRCQFVGELVGIRVAGAVAAEVLGCYLNSPSVRMQTQRLVRGMSAHLYPSDLNTLPIPILPQSTQAKIAVKVRESFDARHEARRLLDEAKAMIEQAIVGGG